MPDVQMTTRLHCGRCFRSGVKYSQCGIGPTYAPRRDAVVVYCTTSPEAPETYTCSPFGHEYFQSGRRVAKRRLHGPLIDFLDRFDRRRARRLPVHAEAMRSTISRRHVDLLLTGVGVDDRFAAAAAEAVDRAAVERVEPDLRRWRRSAEPSRTLPRATAGSSTGRAPAIARADRRRLRSGKSQYIMPMPDGNQSRNSRQSATPSQRWTKMAARLPDALSS